MGEADGEPAVGEHRLAPSGRPVTAAYQVTPGMARLRPRGPRARAGTATLLILGACAGVLFDPHTAAASADARVEASPGAGAAFFFTLGAVGG